jgi:GNAT superfamily N-acetyltransferase
MIRLEPVIATLPAEFETLRAEAGSEGHRMLDTLAAEWASGAMRFDRAGEALLAAYAGDILAGIGGLTFEPTITGALRMRRFYVRAACRRCGAGLMLASTLLDLPRRNGRTVTANAAAGSEAFWEALGSTPDARDGYTHILNG